MSLHLASRAKGLVMVTKRWLEEKWLNPWLERQKAQGYAEAWLLWTEWNQRRIEANEAGVPFNEPPPAAP